VAIEVKLDHRWFAFPNESICLFAIPFPAAVFLTVQRHGLQRNNNLANQKLAWASDLIVCTNT